MGFFSIIGENQIFIHLFFFMVVGFFCLYFACRFMLKSLREELIIKLKSESTNQASDHNGGAERS